MFIGIVLTLSGGPLSTVEFSLDEAKQEISNFCNVCIKGFNLIREAISEPHSEQYADRLAKLVKNEEAKINLFRDQQRDEHINNIESSKYNYQTGVYYMDIVVELERMGDFIINVSETMIEEYGE